MYNYRIVCIFVGNWRKKKQNKQKQEIYSIWFKHLWHRFPKPVSTEVFALIKGLHSMKIIVLFLNVVHC